MNRRLRLGMVSGVRASIGAVHRIAARNLAAR
jgi:hypothetical protein